MSKEYMLYNFDYELTQYERVHEKPYYDREGEYRDGRSYDKVLDREKDHIECHYVEYTDGVATGIATLTEENASPLLLDKTIIGKTKEEVETLIATNVEKKSDVMDDDYNPDNWASYKIVPKQEASSEKEFLKARINEMQRGPNNKVNTVEMDADKIQRGPNDIVNEIELDEDEFLLLNSYDEKEFFEDFNGYDELDDPDEFINNNNNNDKLAEKSKFLDDQVADAKNTAKKELSSDEIAKVRFEAYKRFCKD